jgi:hypothetical protein
MAAQGILTCVWLERRYFVLFLVLFVDKYIRGDTNKGGSSTRTAGEGSSRSSRGKKVD